MLADRTLVLDGGKVRAIGTPEDPVETPPGAATIEAKGKFLIPGLIDAHVHLVHVLDSCKMTGDEILPLFLAAGVTSVRDIGDEIVAETLVARFAEAFPEKSPRVFRCSPLIDRDPPFHRDIGRAVTDVARVPGVRGRDGGLGRHYPQDLRRDTPRYRPRGRDRGPQARTSGRGPPGGLCGTGRCGGRHRRAGAHLVRLRLHHPARGIQAARPPCDPGPRQPEGEGVDRRARPETHVRRSHARRFPQHDPAERPTGVLGSP